MSIGWAIVLFPIACAIAIPLGMLVFALIVGVLTSLADKETK